MTSERNKKRPTLRKKIFFRLLLLSAAVLAVMWLLMAVLLPEVYKRVKLSDVSRTVESVEKKVSGDLAGLEDECASLSEKYGVCILVLDSKGRTAASGDGLDLCVIHRINYRYHAKLYLEAEANGGNMTGYYYFDADTSSFRASEEGERDVEEQLIQTKIVRTDDETYVVFVNSILTPVSSVMRAIRLCLVFVSASWLIFALVFGALMAKSISRPISELSKEAAKLPSGEFDGNKVTRGSREIDGLTDTLTEASSELGKNERLKEELIANITHDLRTPLTMISGYAELMRDVPDEITPENLQIMIDESKRLSSLVEDMVEISKLRSGNAEFTSERFDLTSDVRASVERFAAMLKNDGYSVCFTFEGEAPVCADRKRISQVVYNFISNAVTHTGEDKRVEVRQKYTDFGVRIEVADTGHGIAPEDLPYIWDRYYKVDKYHVRAIEGSGLGLSIVRGIIDAHGGKYGVDSDENGSVFYFELPLAK